MEENYLEHLLKSHREYSKDLDLPAPIYYLYGDVRSLILKAEKTLPSYTRKDVVYREGRPVEEQFKKLGNIKNEKNVMLIVYVNEVGDLTSFGDYLLSVSRKVKGIVLVRGTEKLLNKIRSSEEQTRIGRRLQVFPSM